MTAPLGTEPTPVTLPEPEPSKAGTPAVTRRTVVAGAVGVSAAVSATGLSACGSGSTSSGSGGSGAGSSTRSSVAGTAGGATGTGTVIAKTSDVPVGGGVVVKSAKVVVTQPTAGTYAAFSAVCPHQGCLVNTVVNKEIVCPCHGSKFGLDGSLVAGPAPSGLPAVTVKVSGGNILAT